MFRKDNVLLQIMQHSSITGIGHGNLFNVVKRLCNANKIGSITNVKYRFCLIQYTKLAFSVEEYPVGPRTGNQSFYAGPP